MCQDVIRKYSQSPYASPVYTELYSFDEDEIKKYCEWAKKNYTPIVKDWDATVNTYWTAKFYLATKFIFITNLFLSSFEYARDKNLKITLPYLIYYSLLTISRCLILTSPLDKREITFKRTHEAIINETADIIAKINISESRQYKDIITNAKNNRELFSYKFPASGLRLIKDNSSEISKLVEFIKELAILNSQILDVKLSKIKDKTVFEIDGNFDSVFYSLFDYEGRIDDDDYYNAGYICRKIKRPMPLCFMISEGIEEDLLLNWIPETDSGDDLFTPQQFIFNM